MVPYIAALIILIVAILFTVFKKVDPFSTEQTPNLYDAICGVKPLGMTNTGTGTGTNTNTNTNTGTNTNTNTNTGTGTNTNTNTGTGTGTNTNTNTTTGTNTNTNTATVTGTGTAKAAVAADPSSPEFTKELENRMAKSIATQVKDSLLAQRATENIVQDTSCPYASYSSDAITQGAEYSQAKPHPGPDMSEYVRKDSIPCWNCSLP